MRTHRIALLALAILLPLASCADESDDEGGGIDRERDQATADAALDAGVEHLRAAGFEPSGEEDDDDEFEPTSEECQELEEVLSDNEEGLPGATADVESGDLVFDDLSPEGGVTETASLDVGFSDDADKIDEAFDLFEDERLEGCFAEAMEQAMVEQGVDASGMEFERVDPELGDRSGGILVSLEVSEAGFTFPVELEIVYGRVGRGAALAMRTSVGEGPKVAAGEVLEIVLAELDGE